MVATVEGDRILGVAADRGHPVSGGYSCPKGRAIAEQHHSAARVDRSRLLGSAVPPDVVLDDLAAGLRRLVAKHGPDALARYGGTGLTWDVPGRVCLSRLFGGLGSAQAYSALTLDVAPMARAAELITGFPFNPPTWVSDDDGPSLVVFVGSNPSVSGGYNGGVGSNWTHRLRTFRRQGGEVWVVDPRPTKMAGHANRHLAIRAGADVFLFGWLVRELLDSGADAAELADTCNVGDVERLRAAVASFELEAVVQRTGLEPTDHIELLDAIRKHRKLAIVPGTGVSFQRSAVLTYWLIWATLITTGSLDRKGGMRFLPPGRAAIAPDAARREGHAPAAGSQSPGPASRPDLQGAFGQRPAVALVDEIEAGNVRALFLLGGNPLTAAPQPERLRAAVQKLEVLAVLDAFESELTELATHVLASTWITECDSFLHMPAGGMTRAYLTPALVPPGGERHQIWWWMAQLGRRLGVDVLDGLDPDTIDDPTIVRRIAQFECDYANEAFEAGPRGVDVPFRYGWFREKVLPEGRWRLAPDVLVDRLGDAWNDNIGGLRLVSGRVLRSVNSAPYAEREAGSPPIHLSADAAESRGIRSGDRIRVRTEFGAVEGSAEIDPHLASESVWISHGRTEQNVNMLTDPAVDPLIGQPVVTGIPVELESIAKTGGPMDFREPARR
jgi:anaerobic selenocysteine-containing dehydrogenase